MKDTYVKINVKETVRARLKELASVNGMTLADYLESIAKPVSDTVAVTDHTAKDLVDQLDEAAEAVDPLIADLPQGELPPCCQTIFDDPEHPTPTCPHWKKAWVYHYGNRIVHYKNTLTGGSYFDYFNKYVGA